MKTTGWLVLLLVVSLACPRPLRADDPAPADVLKEKGLVKQGAVYVAGGEEEVLKQMRLLRVSRRKLDDEMKTRGQMEQKIKMAQRTVSQWRMDYAALNDKISTASDPTVQNQLIGRLNATATRVNQGTEEIRKMEGDASKVGTQAKIQFADSVLALAPKADAVSQVYKDVAGDDAVKAALDKLNETARPKLRLGPTPEFSSAANLLKKWRGEVEDENIPVKSENDVSYVDVTLNGNVVKRMIVDTGASIVSLPADIAAELKMTPGPNDPVVKMSIADGSTVDGRLMHLKSVRVGRFTVEDVECVVMPRSMRNAPPLLGQSFLSHFVVKLDPTQGEMHLLELSGATKDTGEKSPGKDPAMKPGK